MYLRSLTDAENTAAAFIGAALSTGLALIIACFVPLPWYGRAGVMLVSAVLLWLPACVPWVVAMKLEPGEKPLE